jgi:scyllo-inositol 2-dehydrogenase (NADP+)
MLNVGIVGYGLSAKTFHAPIISAVEGLRVVAFTRRSTAGTASEAVNFVSYEQMLAHPEIHVIVITTPNQLHFPQAKLALEAGKHVVVEKPFTIDSQEAAELERLARHHERLLCVYHNRRWDGDFQTARELISSGQLGRVVRFESYFDRFRSQPKVNAWREADEPGGGVLYDLAPHLLDQALVLFGAPEAITADIRKEREESVVDDAFDLELHYPRLTVWLGASVLAASTHPRFRICGTQAAYVKRDLDPQENRLKAGEVPSGEDWGKEDANHWGLLTDGERMQRIETKAGDYRKFYEGVRDALRSGKQPPVTAREGWRIMRLLELARESHASRRTIPLEGQLG